jgi:hypothetical protein
VNALIDKARINLLEWRAHGGPKDFDKREIARDILGATASPSQQQEGMNVVQQAWDNLLPVYEAELKRAGTDPNSISTLNTLWRTPQQELPAKIQRMQLTDAQKSLVAQWTTDFNKTADDVENAFVLYASPVQLPSPTKVSPTNKILASSSYIHRQGMLAGGGYVWQDYYRPMTFEAVLNAVLVRANDDPGKRLVDILESMGFAAAALVGLTPVDKYASPAFSQLVAVSTGVFLPEFRKLILEDVESHIKNVGAFALETTISIDPNGTREGYIFFPKGPIFGYGIDEFSMDQPSFIVNVDSTDVAVTGALVDRAFQVESGAKDLVAQALNKGQAVRDQRDKQLATDIARLHSREVGRLQADVADLIESGKSKEARTLIENAKKRLPADYMGILERLEAKIDSRGAAALLSFPNLTEPLVLEAQKDDKGNVTGKYVGTYSLRLTDEPAATEVVTVVVSGQSIGVRVPITFKIKGKEAAPAANLTLQFAATPDATKLKWSDPVQIEVVVDPLKDADKSTLSLQHDTYSGDARFDRVRRTLSISIPAKKEEPAPEKTAPPATRPNNPAPQ